MATSAALGCFLSPAGRLHLARRALAACGCGLAVQLRYELRHLRVAGDPGEAAGHPLPTRPGNLWEVAVAQLAALAAELPILVDGDVTLAEFLDEYQEAALGR